jgi:hypothetical protein
MIGEIYGLWRIVDYFLSNPCSSDFQEKEQQKQLKKLRDTLRETVVALGGSALFDGK